MTDRKRMHESVGPMGMKGEEPARDLVLGARLREIVGTPPEARVDFAALAHRITVATSAPVQLPWWSYAARWERRALPLAFAAGIAGAIALWGLGAPTQLSAAAAENADLVTAVAAGVSADDVARSLARSITADPSVEVPE